MTQARYGETLAVPLHLILSVHLPLLVTLKLTVLLALKAACTLAAWFAVSPPKRLLPLQLANTEPDIVLPFTDPETEQCSITMLPVSPLLPLVEPEMKTSSDANEACLTLILTLLRLAFVGRGPWYATMTESPAVPAPRTDPPTRKLVPPEPIWQMLVLGSLLLRTS